MTVSEIQKCGLLIYMIILVAYVGWMTIMNGDHITQVLGKPK